MKSFAPAVRRQLMEAVERKLDYVLSADTPDLRTAAAQVKSLRRQAERDRAGLVERVAYTWFNRLAALRFLDARGWHPFKARVLTAATAEETQPELLKLVRTGSLPEELQPHTDPARLNDLLDGRLPTAIAGSDPQGEVYRHLILAVCRFYHATLPFLFEEINDETELLLPDDLLTAASVAEGFRTQITDEACGDVEVLGWLYQFYISEKKDQVFAGLKKNIKITAENIPAATQLFTPHWIVRYLVENSLGRLWMLNRPNSRLVERMDYYIKPEEPETDFLRISKPDEIKICDPACGSGHMLTYAFDLLYAIYEEEGYEAAEIPGLILRHNLTGIEIDERAGALAAFALVMKAVERLGRRRFLRLGVQPNIVVLENVQFEEGELPVQWLVAGDQWPEGKAPPKTDILHDLHLFAEAKNFGSLLQPKLSEAQITFLKQRVTDHWPQTSDSLLAHNVRERVLKLLQMAEALSPKYHVVVANPPYMGSKGMNGRLGAWTKDNYPRSKSDLFAMFIERNLDLARTHGTIAMITMQSWMFLTTYETFRENLLGETSILSMAHLGPRAFDSIGGEVVSTSAFVLEKSNNPEYKGHYLRLIDGGSEKEKESNFRNQIDYFYDRDVYRCSTEDFKKMPGSPIAYWASKGFRNIFSTTKPLDQTHKPRAGTTTTNNERFIRLWYEVGYDSIELGARPIVDARETNLKWFPYNKGGGFRKYYGNNEYLLNWENDGAELKDWIVNHPVDPSPWSRYIRSIDYYFKPGISWGDVAGKFPSFRWQQAGYIAGSRGPMIFIDELNGLLAYLNSALARKILAFLNPTLTFNVGNIAELPFVGDMLDKEFLVGSTHVLVDIGKHDWDAYETSWDFQQLPLILVARGQWLGASGEAVASGQGLGAREEPNPATSHQPLATNLSEAYAKLRSHWKAMTLRMKELEEENNRIFIEAYGLQDELTPEVPIEEITLTCNPAYRYGVKTSEAEREKRLLADTMKEFLSYAVGCMFGRYSLDAPGLILANAGETVEDYFRVVASGQGLVAGEEEGSKNYESAKLQGSDCLAEGHGDGGGNLPGDSGISEGGDLRADQSASPGGSVSSLEHRGGASQTGDGGVQELPFDSEGFTGRSGDATANRQGAELHQSETTHGNHGSAHGSGQNAERPDQQASHQPLATSHLSYLPDKENILPMMEGEWFPDNINIRFREFLRVTFGEDSFAENLRFLEKALGKDLHKYFVRDFYKDHVRRYKKRPIYWLVTSPKGSFQALFYLHRYTRDTVNTLLNSYLREFLHKLEARIAHLDHVEATADSPREKTAARKEADKLKKALKECRDWERDTVLPLAQQRIELDLDDGVKVNYQKLPGLLAKIPGLEKKE